MEKLNRGDKMYLDKDNTKESCVNIYLECRDGIVECYEYNDCSGYGSKTRLFLCENYKHEHMAIIRQIYIDNGNWVEEVMSFDSDSFELMKALITGNRDKVYGKYTLVRSS